MRPYMLLLLGAAAAACAPRASTLPAPSQDAPTAAVQAGAGYTVADVRFMQDMIGHHRQALVMAALAPTNGASTSVLRLAQKIDISQRDEIALMRQWLRQRNQPVPDSAHHQHALMPGMLTTDEMARLAAARGAEFDRLFLSFMIRHHEGALQMADDLVKTAGAAQDPDLFRFVTDVDADQRDEIYVMQQLLHTPGQVKP